jgi:hypothetical protein
VKPAAIFYSSKSLSRDLERLHDAWVVFQASRSRTAIYPFLQSVYDLLTCWQAERRMKARVRRALWVQGIEAPDSNVMEPVAGLIAAVCHPEVVDKRTRCKWSQALRYAIARKPDVEPLATFIRRKGGINDCAARYRRIEGPVKLI